MADTKISYGSMEDVMSVSPEVAKMITGEYFQGKIDRQVGKNEAQKQAEREAAQKAMSVRSIKAGVSELANIYSEEGYDVRYTIDTETMAIKMFLVPREVKNKEQLTMDQLKQYKAVDIFLNNNRIIDKNGQRGIGGIVPVELDNGSVGVYSFAEHQVWAQVEAAKKEYMKEKLKDRTAEGNEEFTKAMRAARRKAASQQSTAGQQTPLSAEGRQARSGTGTLEQIAARDDMIFADYILSQFLTDKNIRATLYRGYNQKEHGSKEAYINKMQSAAYGVASLLSSGWTEEEIAKSDPMYRTIVSSLPLMEKLKNLSKLGLYHTLTGESAGKNFIYSAIPKSSFSGGWADEESSNKRLKVANRMEVLNPEAKKNKTLAAGSITPYEKAAGISMDDDERRLYQIQKRKIDFFNKARKILHDKKIAEGMSEEDFVKIYGTELSGLGLDSLIYSSEIEEGLGGYEFRPAKLDKDKVKERIEKLKVKKKDEKHTDEEWMRLAVADILEVAQEDVNQIDAESSEEFVKVEYKFNQEMMSGFKILLQAAYERGAAIKVHKDIFDIARSVKEMGESALKRGTVLVEEAGPLKAKGISGFIAQTMSLITGVGRENADQRKKINDILAKTAEGGLGQYVKWDDEIGGYLEDYTDFENKTDQEKEEYFNKIIPTLNEILKAIGANKDIITTETDAEGKVKYIISDRWAGATAANQISQYRYGEPGDEVVTYDYRGREALTRAISIASVSGKDKENLDVLSEFLMDVTNVDEEAQKAYNKAKSDAEESRKKTLATAAEDFKINEDNNEILFNISEEQLKADREIAQHRKAAGYFDKEAFEKTSMYAIYREQHPEDPNKAAKTVYIDYGKAGTLAKTDEKGKKVWGSNATALTDFQVEEVRDEKTNKIIGYRYNENLAGAYRKLVEAKNKYQEVGGDNKKNLENLIDTAIGYSQTVHDDVASKEGISWKRGYAQRVAHSMFAMTEAANYALLDELFADESLDKDFKDLTDEEKFAIAQKRNLKHILTASDQMAAEDAAELMRAQGDEKQKEHMLTLGKEYERMYGGNFEDWYKQNQKALADEKRQEAEDNHSKNLATIEKNFNESHKDYYTDENGNIITGTWVDQYKNPIQIAPGEKAPEGAQWMSFEDFGYFTRRPDDNITSEEDAGAVGLRNYFRILENERYQERLDEAKEIQNKALSDLSEKAAKIINEKLISSIIDGVTVGSKAFNERIRKNLAEGGDGVVEGLFEIFSRFPESNGIDRKFVEAYVAGDLTKGQSRVGLGLGRSVNQDNDGDRIVRHLALMSTKALQSRNYDEIIAEFRKVKAMMDDVSEMVAKAELKDMKESAGKGVVLTSEDIQELASKRRGEVTALKAKINKNYTGWLSNEFQAVTEAASGLGIDEKGLGEDVESQTKSANAMIARGFFESLTQDAISSKKVAERIMGKYGDDAFEEGSQFFTDIDKLVKDLSKAETYNDIPGLVKRIQDMKILGEDDKGVFTTRINELILGTITKYGHGGAILKDLFGEEVLKQHFGDKEYTEQDVINAVKNAELHLGGEQLIRALQATHESLRDVGGLGGAIIGRKQLVPGLGAISGDPVSTLGLAISNLGPAYQHLLEIVDKLAISVDKERASEEAKIKVLGKEKAAVKGVSSEYYNLGSVLRKIAEENNTTVDQLTAEQIKSSYYWLKGLSKPWSATLARGKMRSLEDQTKYQKAPIISDEARRNAIAAAEQKGAPLTETELGTILGLRNKDDLDALRASYSAFNRGSFTGNVVQLISELKAANYEVPEQGNLTDREYIESLVALGQKLYNDPNAELSEETRKVIETYINRDLIDEHGEHTDILTLFDKLKEAETLFGGIDESFSTTNLIAASQNIYKLLDSLGMTGKNLVGTEVGSVGVIAGQPFSTTADIVTTEDVVKDGQTYKRLIFGDIKSHGTDNYTAEDAFQVAMEMRGAEELIKVLSENSSLFNKDDKAFEAFQKEIIAARYRAAGLSEDAVKNILDQTPVLSKELAADLVKAKEAGIDNIVSGRLIVSNKRTGVATAYEASLDYTMNALLNKVFAGENLTPKEAEIVGKLYGLKGTTATYINKSNKQNKYSKGNWGNYGGGGSKKSLFDQLGWNKESVGRSLTQFLSFYRILGKIRQEIQKVIQITKQLDQAITNIRIVTGMNRQEVDNAILSYSKLAESLGATTTELANSANGWLRQGYSISESMSLIEASVKLSKLGMLDMNTSTKVLTSTLKGFKMEAGEAESVVDKLTKLDMNYAASAGEIGEAMSRTSAIASQMGMSFDETAAMVTVLMDVTQQSSEMAGTAIRSILARYGNVKSGSFLSMMTEGEDLEKINDIEKVLGVLGISIRSSKMEMRSMSDVLDELATKWNTLSSVEQSAVATAFAGTRQRNAFQTILSNWERIKEAQQISADSAGTAEEKYAAYMDSIEAHLKKITNAWETLTQRLGASNAIKTFVDSIAFAVEHLDKVITHTLAFLTAFKAYKIPSLFNSLKGGLGNFGLPGASMNLTLGAVESKTQTGIVSKGFFNVTQELEQIKQIISKGSATHTGNFVHPLFDEETRSNLLKNGRKSVGADGKEVFEELGADEKRVLKKFGYGMGFYDKDSKIAAVYMKGEKGKGFYGYDKNNKYIGRIEEGSAEYEALEKQRKRTTYGGRLVRTGLATGAVAGLSAGLSGTNSYFGNNEKLLGLQMGTKDVKINDVQSDATDKVINGAATGITTGLLSAIPVAGPILGPVLGPIIGDGIGGLFKWLRHKDEMDRKQRVKDAQEQLEAINKVQSATEAVESAVYDLSTAKAVQEAKEKIDELIYQIKDSDVISSEILEKITGVSGDWNEQFTKLQNILLSTNDEEKDDVLAKLYALLAKEEAEEKYASLEEERANAFKTREDEENDLQKQWRKGKISEIEYEKKLRQSREKYEKQMTSLNRQTWNAQLSAAFYGSGLSTWSTNKIRGDSLEDVVQIFANNLELTGQKVRDFSGDITKEARVQIETFLRQNEKYNYFFSSSEKTLREMLTYENRRNKIEKEFNLSYVDILDAYKRQDFDALAEATGKSRKELEGFQKEVFEISGEDLTRLANTLNLTEEKTLELADKFGNLSASLVGKTPSELRESANDLISMFSELASKGYLAGEALEKLNSTYLFLYNRYDENGDLVSTSKENITDNIMQMLFAPDSQMAMLYQNSMFNSNYLSNEDFFKSFKERGNIPELLKSINRENAKTLSEVISILGSNEDFQKELTAALNDLEVATVYYSEITDKLISWQKHENEKTINNLKSQIDALKNVNDERKEELELIKAKDALENAKNEKKKVYRAGVGWTFETDQQAIKDARDKLEQLENDRDAENLQYQVDLLEQQNSILDNVSKNEELEALKSVVEDYTSFMKENFGTKVFDALQYISYYLSPEEIRKSFNWDNFIENYIEADETGKNSVIKDLQEAETQFLNVRDQLQAEQSKFNSGEVQDNKEVIKQQELIVKIYDKLLKNYNILKNDYGVEGLDHLTDSEVQQLIASGTSPTVDSEQKLYKIGGVSYITSGEDTLESGNLVDKFSAWKNNAYRIDKETGKATIIDMSESEYKKYADGTVLKISDGSNVHYYIKENGLFKELKQFSSNASGTYDLQKAGPTLINELGTEGIITPQGTLTSLPSHTGIVPADLTRNLYKLGEIAPNLIKGLSLGQNLVGKNMYNTEDNSMNINTLNATFETGSDFDFNKFLIQARQYVATTKNYKN